MDTFKVTGRAITTPARHFLHLTLTSYFPLFIFHSVCICSLGSELIESKDWGLFSALWPGSQNTARQSRCSVNNRGLSGVYGHGFLATGMRRSYRSQALDKGMGVVEASQLPGRALYPQRTQIDHWGGTEQGLGEMKKRPSFIFGSVLHSLAISPSLCTVSKSTYCRINLFPEHNWVSSHSFILLCSHLWWSSKTFYHPYKVLFLLNNWSVVPTPFSPLVTANLFYLYRFLYSGNQY